MKPLQWGALLAMLVLAVRTASADAPPPPAELQKLLESEPINQANWAKWSPRLREWSGEHFEAALPAFQSAFDFVKKQAKPGKGLAKGFSLPKGLDQDAVAWMVLSGAILHELNPTTGPVQTARFGQDAARQSLKRDKGLARSHFYLCWAIKREQTTPVNEGGPAKIDAKRMNEALQNLQEARALDPKGKWFGSKDAAEIAVETKRWDVAETFLREALKEFPAAVMLGRDLAKSINLQVKREGTFAEAVKPVVDLFPKDGIVVSYYALAFIRDKKNHGAAVQIALARQLGTEPGEIIGMDVVRRIDQEQPAPPVEAPPTKAELIQLLKNEPINLANWPKWSPRLRGWSGEHFDAVFPAFVDAVGFVRKQERAKGDNLSFPPELDRDPVAWMILSVSYLIDPDPANLGRVPRARRARKAAERSIGMDPNLARAHFFLCRAIRREEMTAVNDGGPKQPDRGRLRHALEELLKARELEPRAKFYPAKEAGLLAIEAERFDVAETFLAEALKESPKDVQLARLLARSINGQDRRRGGYTDAVKPLTEQFPDDGGVASHYALALSLDKKYPEAAVQLARTRELGVDPAKYIRADAVQKIEDEESHQALVSAPGNILATIGKGAMWFTIFYGSLMILMCVGGLVLARFTRGPRAAKMLGRPPEELAAGGTVLHTTHESWLKRFYLFTMLLALVLFYFSLPFVFIGLLLFLVVSLVVALCLSRAKDAEDVQSALLCASGGGISALFKAMFARVGTGGFGIRMGRRDCPRLWRALEDVAERVDTDPVDEVWVAPGSDFCVHQEGRGPFGVFGGRKRVLTIGLCVLDFLTIDEFKAILAHEYAHFSHADTFWSRFLFQVTLSLRTAMREMARTGGWVTYINPFYWFFWLYSKSYSLLAAGFSRSREFLADRMACTLYGSDVFARALRKVCTDGVHFEMTVYDNILRLLRNKKAYVNMYLAFRKQREEKMTDEERRKFHRDLLDDKSSVFRSHPTFKERMEAARQLPMAEKTVEVSSLQLFEDPEEIERELTDFLTDVVHHQCRI